jgi:multidrug resistance efflux pump
MKRFRFGRLVLPVLAIGMLTFAVIHVVKAQQKPPALPPPIEPARTPFGRTVAGSGITEPVTENISIGAALPGLVLEVYVPVDTVDTVRAHVKKGDPLFKVDDRQLLATLAYNKANLSSADAQLAKFEAMPRKEEVPPSEAAFAAAEANLALQQDLADRNSRLYPARSVAEQDYRQSVLTAVVARRQREQAKANLELLKAGAWSRDIDIAKAAQELAKAQIQQTQTDIERCIVRAPCDGDVIQVNVRAGEYVSTSASQALMVLGDLANLHVRVDIDEHDIPRFRRKAPAKASVRGTPQVQFELEFVRVEPYVIPKKSLTGDNTERVDTRVLQGIYRVKERPMELFVGQQMDVFIEAAPPPEAKES